MTQIDVYSIWNVNNAKPRGLARDRFLIFFSLRLFAVDVVMADAAAVVSTKRQPIKSLT